jgi:hypothetical protein
MLRTLLLALLAPLLANCSSIQPPPMQPGPRAESGETARQIHWQRSLDDALALSKSSGRPLLVALNMDGESASERIVRERYHDSEFVRWTRNFVCVVGSVFRHSLVDHDANGVRVPCPRLGEVTCAEHIALEPEIFGRYLAEPRVSPRHALIQADGTKSFDLFLLFDLGDLDKALHDAAVQATGRAGRPATLEPAGLGPAARTQRARSAHEEQLRTTLQPERALQQLMETPSADAEAFFALAVRAESAAPEFSAQLGKAACEKGHAQAHARFLRERLALVSPSMAGGVDTRGGRARHLLGLAECVPQEPFTRTQLIAEAVVGRPEERELARRALRRVLAAGELSALDARLAEAGGPLDARRALQLAQALPVETAQSDARASEAMSVLEEKLVRAEERLRQAEFDFATQYDYGRAALDLARARLAAGSTRELAFLLEDARTWLQRSATGSEQLLALCEAHFRLSEFAEQEQVACRVLQLQGSMPAWDARQGEDAAATTRLLRAKLDASWNLRESLRWVGDGAARNLARRAAPADALEELGGILRGADALELLMLSSYAGESDCAALASFHEALGQHGIARAWWLHALARLPESNAVREGCLRSHWRAGQLRQLGDAYAELAARRPLSAACAWYAGSARVLEAEDWRRREAPQAALEAYAQALNHYTRAEELYAQLDAQALALGAREQQARVLLGMGFAHLIADQRAQAAEQLLAAVQRDARIENARDGLDREPVDLVDQCLEWRASGPSPVDALDLLNQLLLAAGQHPVWALRIADAQLREARRSIRRASKADGLIEAGRAVEAARLALAHPDANPEQARRALVLPLMLSGETLLDLGRASEARERLAQAAVLAGVAQPIDESATILRSTLAELTRLYGEAAPVPREGR